MPIQQTLDSRPSVDASRASGSAPPGSTELALKVIERKRRFLTRASISAAVIVLLGMASISSVLAANAATGARQILKVPIARVWSLAHDLAAAPSENPVPDQYGHAAVWYLMASAGSAHDPASYAKLPRFITDQFGIPGLDSRQGDFLSQPHDWLPQIGVNVTRQARDYKGIGWPAGAVLAHPLPDRMAVIGWKSPINGTVTAAGTLALAQHPSCSNGVVWSLDLGSQTLASGIATASAPGSFQHTIALRAGQQLYVTIGANRHVYYCDSTLISW